MALQQRGAKGHGVGASGRRGLVHEALFEEGLMRVADGAPEAHRHGQIHRAVSDAHVRHFVGLVEGAFTRRLVGADEGQTENALKDLRRDGLAGAGIAPSLQAALRVEPGLKTRHAGRAIEVVLHVLLARPQRLHRPTLTVLGDGRSLADEVDVEPPPEAAAELGDDEIYLVGGDAQGVGCSLTCQARHLRRRPHRGAAVLELHRAVDGLHRSVREIRRAVFGADDFRCALQRRVDIAARVEREAVVVVQRGRELVHHLGA